MYFQTGLLKTVKEHYNVAVLHYWICNLALYKMKVLYIALGKVNKNLFLSPVTAVSAGIFSLKECCILVMAFALNKCSAVLTNLLQNLSY